MAEPERRNGARTWVVKLGSALLTRDGSGLDEPAKDELPPLLVLGATDDEQASLP